ncbi:YciI family protein [Thaumasiovibrio subtropicus]|uniref:YciI family protein n=1 Tax=Thaumasiovibrio subtropicus TaxID=1891207 RepID=UPI000B361F37|nr:YciI family protein [Thaumasiovibrio subtropicus]
MNTYMLIYLGGDPEWHAKTTPEEMAAAMAQWTQWMEVLRSKDQLVDGGVPLEFGGVRVNKEGMVTDIAASEFKELVSGFSLVKAETDEQLMEIIKACPIFNHPEIEVEVRKVMCMG